jgi:acyl-CoA synthetase (AMP-forming)/AMP-acid ligase II
VTKKEYPILVFALLKLAIPLVFLPSQSTFHETVSLLNLSAVTLTALFVSERLYPYAAVAAKEIGLPEERIFILQGEVSGKASLPRLIDDVKSRGLPNVPSQSVKDDTLAYLVFSSGTTGLPKGIIIIIFWFLATHFEIWTNSAVMVSHRNLMFSALQSVPVAEEMTKVYTVRIP